MHRFSFSSCFRLFFFPPAQSLIDKLQQDEARVQTHFDKAVQLLVKSLDEYVMIMAIILSAAFLSYAYHLLFNFIPSFSILLIPICCLPVRCCHIFFLLIIIISYMSGIAPSPFTLPILVRVILVSREQRVFELTLQPTDSLGAHVRKALADRMMEAGCPLEQFGPDSKFEIDGKVCRDLSSL